MNVNITGKINVFVERKEITDKDKNKKSIVILSTSIEQAKDKKNPDAKRARIYCDVSFTSKATDWPQSRLDKLKEDHCYTIDILDGFLGVRAWDYNGEQNKRLVIFVNDAKAVAAKQFERKKPVANQNDIDVTDDDLPF